MPAIEKKLNNRVFYLDLLRVIACLTVVLIHSSAKYVSENFGSINFWAGNLLDSLSRIGVPLFVMISGALMLDKNYNCTRQKLTKHISRMVIFFIFWSAFYTITYNIIVQVFIHHKSINLKKTIGAFISGNFHLWFIYLIIGLYLIVPLLRLWVKDENKKYIEYFIILSIVFTVIIPQIISVGSNYSDYFETINKILEKKLQLKYVGGYTAYFILGWYLNNYDIKHKKLIYVMGVLGFTVTFFGTYILSSTTGKAVQMYEYLYINVLLQSVAVFTFIKSKYINKQKDNKIINSISKYSLGIYAIHALIIRIMKYVFAHYNINLPVINIAIIFIVSFTAAYLASIILSKIPLLKKVV